MKATIENLKANRVVIIATLTELFGAECLKSKMQSLLFIVESAEAFNNVDSIEDAIDMLVDMSTSPRRKASKTANMLAEMAFNRGEEWDNKTQKYVKF